MKFTIALTAILLITGCSTIAPYSSDVLTALSAIQGVAKSLSNQGFIPPGKTADVVNDAGTLEAALQTLNTGGQISTTQANAVAASFKSNSSTTAYIQLGVNVINILVPLINTWVSQGLSKSEIQDNTSAVLVNLPSAVQSGATAP